ncbi:MAG: hypothetical protein ACI81L_000890 [Verrucomicrobiales bacterium]|jgi:hypothetical protein
MDDVDAALAGRIRRILSEVEEADFERVEPPVDVWEGIEASIRSDPGPLSPKEPLYRVYPASTVVEYWIDADDAVTDVGRSWADFAHDNDAPELAVPAPGRALWTYFDNEEIREGWQLLVERVRALQEGAQVPLRCDAPHARRWFDMTITPEPNGRVHFRSVLVFEEARPTVSLLDPHSERDDGLRPVALCSWCGQGQHGSLWLDIEELVQTALLLERVLMPPISHGICGSCRDEISAELLVPSGVDESTA